MKRWSKLQKALYNIMDRSDNFQFHCSIYKMKNSLSKLPYIPRYWITTGKGKNTKIIWSYPLSHNENVEQFATSDISEISYLIREYIDTPRLKLQKKEFKSDRYGITKVLKAHDRRFKHSSVQHG